MAQQPLVGPPHYRGFTTLGMTPLDEWLALRRNLYLTTHTVPKRQTSIPPSGIRPHSPSKQAASDPLLRPRGHWDINSKCNFVVQIPA